MSQLRYNNITLPYPLTTSFRQEVVLDDSGTDWMCTKFEIMLQAIINVNYVDQLAPDLVTGGNLFPLSSSTQNPADIMNIIRSRLLDQRKALSYKVNGIEMIPGAMKEGLANHERLPGTVDVRNGPQPQSCTINQMTTETFLITYHIIAHYWEKNRITPDGSPIVQNLTTELSPVLSNRWTERVNMDNCQFSTRTREGKYVIRSDNRSGQIVDEFRSSMAVVAVPDGFLRESSQYIVSADGLSLNYQIVDREVFKKPPNPAFTATGEYVETTGRPGYNKANGMCSVRLQGDKTTSQDALLTAAVSVVTSKLLNRGAVITGRVIRPFAITEMAVIKVDLYNNAVEFSMQVMYEKVQERFFTTTFQRKFNQQRTTTPGSDGGETGSFKPPYKDRGTASILLQAAAYFDPSLNATLHGGNPFSISNSESANFDKNQMSQGMKVGEAGKTLENKNREET